MSATVGLLGLWFAVASFWWLQARTGDLESYVPQTYAGYVKAGDFRLRFPLTIYNTGARTLVVTDLRAVFLASGMVAPVISFRGLLRPTTDEPVDFAHPFAVDGRKAESRFVEFGRTDWAPALDDIYRLRIDIKASHKPDWHPLIEFELHAPESHLAGSYVAHRRDPRDNAPEPDDNPR